MDASRMIDKKLGQASNNLLELGFAEVWGADIKKHSFGEPHFRVDAIFGLLRSNTTATEHVKGPDYGWQKDVRQRMGLPDSNIFDLQHKNSKSRRINRRDAGAQPEAKKAKARAKHQKQSDNL